MKITTLQEARDLDPTVNRCIREGKTLEQIIIELVNERLEKFRLEFQKELNAAGGIRTFTQIHDPWKDR